MHPFSGGNNISVNIKQRIFWKSSSIAPSANETPVGRSDSAIVAPHSHLGGSITRGISDGKYIYFFIVSEFGLRGCPNFKVGGIKR